MPFDGRNLDIGAPSLRTLADVLRDRSRWPAGFVWGYQDSNCCAVGMARELWPRLAKNDTEFLRALGIPFGAAFAIFTTLHADRPMSSVQPEHVADAIDAYLSRRSTP
jgi:hypothetical protein